jgi:hypothetical protein
MIFPESIIVLLCCNSKNNKQRDLRNILQLYTNIIIQYTSIFYLLTPPMYGYILWAMAIYST